MHLINSIYTHKLDCYQKYTQVSREFGNRLDEVLKEIEQFYYSDFWIHRFKRRLQEERLNYNSIELDILQGTTSLLREDSEFKLFNEDPVQNGISNNKTMIALNINLDPDEINDSHIKNVIMHEFGHRQYNQKEFEIVRYLNNIILKDSKEYIKDRTLTKNDLEYFSDDNELRQRIIPIIKEMKDNYWNSYEAYQYSKNLNIDDIKQIYNKKYIITLLENIL